MHHPALYQSDSMKYSENGAFDRSNLLHWEAMNGDE